MPRPARVASRTRTERPPSCSAANPTSSKWRLRLLTASARLCQLLNLDPSIRLHPTDAFVVPHPLVPDPIPVSELIALGLLRRPELGAQRASIIQGLLALDAAKALPFSPTVYIGFSAGRLRRW